jgi:hypothetical protein
MALGEWENGRMGDVVGFDVVIIGFYRELQADSDCGICGGVMQS